MKISHLELYQTCKSVAPTKNHKKEIKFEYTMLLCCFINRNLIGFQVSCQREIGNTMDYCVAVSLE